ncbi:hydroxycarboxylic acid receptor 2-like [Lepisosteus oculatus]|uniref:hydroxycarboxylic acid receptor 2-like n=1 Tax=Lepisosteus oculatus TaxID=7918 RepID=UPI0035F52F64
MMNDSCPEDETTCRFDGSVLLYVLPPVLFVECLLATLGNGIALWIFCFHLKPWKTSTVFLFNLALADFLLSIILPFRTSYYVRGKDWIFGDVFCRISLFMLAMNRGGSILFLTAVAVDRYFRVVHPHHPVNSMSIAKAACFACALWALAIAMTVYLLTMPHHFCFENATHCESFTTITHHGSDSVWHEALYFLEFVVPLAVTLYCSLQIICQLKGRQVGKHSKIRRAVYFVGAVVMVFVICFLPSNVTRLVIWAKKAHHIEHCDSYKSLDDAFFITVSLTYLNSVLDPVVYYFSSPTFKRIYRAAVKGSLHRQDKEHEEPGVEKMVKQSEDWTTESNQPAQSTQTTNNTLW